MKKSIFTSVFTRDGESVAFNSLTGALAHLGSDGLDAIKGNASGTVLADELQDAGFFAPEDIDEFDLLEQRFLTDMNTTDFLSLCIAPTMQCNLRCPYCYEEHENVRMTPEVEDAIVRFVEKRFDKYHFNHLEVVWYGGEPTLEVDTISSLSDKFITWANENNVSYNANIVTNATLVNDEMADLLAKANITHAMPTVDGCADCHDKRRVKMDGSGSFAQTMDGIRAMSRSGIAVNANSNLDKTALAHFKQLESQIAEIPGATLDAAHLREYGGWPSKECAKRGNFDMLSRKEFADAQFAAYAEKNPSAESLYETLRAKRMFCQGKMASYFSIDPEGNVYRCDGHLRDPKYIMFNVLDDEYEFDWPETKTLSERNERCRNCSVAPMCLGQCDWEWSMFNDNCQPVKYSLAKYVWYLHDKLIEGVDINEIPQVCILVPPRNVDEIYAQPFSIADERGLIG